MTQGFYEQLGVPSDATAPTLRAAYSRVVAHLVRRRKALVEQGGDPEPLDLAREQVDEAWRVLSDPARRRRYDALLALSFADDRPDATALWDQVAGSLVPPGLSAAARFVQLATHVDIGDLPTPLAPPDTGPGSFAGAGEPTLVPADDPSMASSTSASMRGFVATGDPDTVPPQTDPRAVITPPSFAVTADTEPPEPPEADTDPGLVRLPTAAAAPVEPSLRLVHGNREGSPIFVMPTPQLDAPSLSAEDGARLVEVHGHSGALLRAAREQAGQSLDDLAEQTRISARYLDALERDAFDQLPSATFVRGYVREFAQVLGLDADATSEGYMRRFRR